ncbi:putative membrane protein [Agitococcus lubricus]|uniref:Protoporphyrinogen IX oxidase n=2 Tax=Agitococcus lubricus TaxID=1077255 RepID=A0A2T5IWU1_9GAMM|nr:putative membrane protein [Agitococcus lubricus]
MLWLKAFHIVAVICWFAGLFYLPRLFVYHAQSEDTISIERFKIMERKLYRGIMWPSMVLTIVLGAAMIYLAPAYYLQQGWLHAKLTLVGLLIVYHFYCGYYRQRFADNQNNKTHTFYRVFNELPVVLLIVIVILVVVKPF